MMRRAKSTMQVSSLITTDRKSTRLNSSHSQISYAVFCLKKKKIHDERECRGLSKALHAVASLLHERVQERKAVHFAPAQSACFRLISLPMCAAVHVLFQI